MLCLLIVCYKNNENGRCGPKPFEKGKLDLTKIKIQLFLSFLREIQYPQDQKETDFFFTLSKWI